jgi:hypothetical protein
MTTEQFVSLGDASETGTRFLRREGGYVAQIGSVEALQV